MEFALGGVGLLGGLILRHSGLFGHWPVLRLRWGRMEAVVVVLVVVLVVVGLRGGVAVVVVVWRRLGSLRLLVVVVAVEFSTLLVGIVPLHCLHKPKFCLLVFPFQF